MYSSWSTSSFNPLHLRVSILCLLSIPFPENPFQYISHDPLPPLRRHQRGGGHRCAVQLVEGGFVIVFRSSRIPRRANLRSTEIQGQPSSVCERILEMHISTQMELLTKSIQPRRTFEIYAFIPIHPAVLTE
jgi:hypothetical protein